MLEGAFLILVSCKESARLDGGHGCMIIASRGMVRGAWGMG